MKLISVIVPIYKVEKYLNRCIDSIINQTYKNLEIILVDDGSPDNCGKICDDYAKKDKRIKVIHKENGGLSSARNAGLDIAIGEWISFIDSDDWIEPDMYEYLINSAQKFNSQISVGGVSDEIDDNGEILIVKTTEKSEDDYVLSKTDAMKKFFLGSWAAWDKIYSAEIFKDIRYPEGEINEDEAIVLQVLEKAERVVYTNKVFYHYIRRADSITTSTFHEKKLVWCKHCEDNLRFIEENYLELIPYAKKRYYSSLIWSLDEMAKDFRLYKNHISSTRNILKKVYKEYINITELNLKYKIKYFILVYLYKLYVVGVTIINKYNT